jgi:hypothetical protein
MLSQWYGLGWGGLHQQHYSNLILEDGLVLYHLIERGRDTLIDCLNEAWVDVTGCCASSQCAACSCSCCDRHHRVVCCTVAVINFTFKHIVHVVYSVSQPRCMFRNSIKLGRRVYVLWMNVFRAGYILTKDCSQVSNSLTGKMLDAMSRLSAFWMICSNVYGSFPKVITSWHCSIW